VLGGADDYRVVIDEDSLDWRELTQHDVISVVDVLADLLQPMADGQSVALMDLAYDIESLPGVPFSNIPYRSATGISRDARVRLAKLMDKCRTLQPDADDIPRPVNVDGGPQRELSWGVTHAVGRAAAGRRMSCLAATPDGTDSRWLTVTDSAGVRVEVHRMSGTDGLRSFWRTVIGAEARADDHFFESVHLCFPNLIFEPSLRFHPFHGSFGEVLPWLVQLLGAVNDDFAATLAQCQGDQNQVIARFSAAGLTISPESPNTRKDTRAWAARHVEFAGRSVRCEWHGKRLPTIDRVHFSLPLPEHDGRILVGIFVDHLP
jgi:hypothetical protein